MGTMLQRSSAPVNDAYPGDTKNNCDLRSLTTPSQVEDIHAAYFEAGADIAETNTFGATSIAQSDFSLADAVEEMNTTSVRLARKAALRVEAKMPGRRCYVAGAIGPTNRTLSLSPDVQRPDYRAVTWAQVVGAYREQTRALLRAGVDALLVETIFDTLNAKAALFAIGECFEELGAEVPLIVSATVTDAAGRTLSGQTVTAFWYSIRHAQPLAVGLNCALGAQQLRPYVAELARIADCAVCCYPNAGLPNAMGEYDESPSAMAKQMGAMAAEGLLNIAGGCCGTTPEHIQAIAAAVAPHAPRMIPQVAPAMRLSGLEPLIVA